MSQLYVGFARVDITPMTGISLKGYYAVRSPVACLPSATR